MKIAPKNIEEFIINVPKNIKAILLYGPDHGLINFRLSILKKTRNFTEKFNYDQIKNNPSLFLDSFKSFSLFDKDLSQEKIILIECNNSTLSTSCSDAIKKGEYQGLIIFYADGLTPDSNLRKFFETNNNTAAIPCYLDDSLSISRIIQQKFKQNNITYEAGLVPMLINYITTGDRFLILNEIEKIILFLGDKKHIVSSDLKDYLILQEEVSFDKLCYKISLKQITHIEKLLTKLEHEGHNLVSISRMLVRHFTRIYQVKNLIYLGKTEQQALTSLYPPVFFKQINDFSQSLRLWNEKELIDFLSKLNQIELTAKSKPSSANLMLKSTILSLLSK